MIRSHPLRSLLTATLLLAAIGGTASAAPLQDEGESWWAGDSGTFSYTYVQARYDFVDLDTLGDGESFSGRALVNVWKPLYVRGEYGFQDSTDIDTETTSYLVSLGYHTSLVDRFDVFVEGGFISQETETGATTVDADGPLVSVGLRGISPEAAVEGEFRYSHYWLQADGLPTDDLGRFNFDLIWHATEHLGLVVGGAWEVQAGGKLPYQAYGAGLRLTL